MLKLKVKRKKKITQERIKFHSVVEKKSRQNPKLLFLFCGKLIVFFLITPEQYESNLFNLSQVSVSRFEVKKKTEK